ncbi:flavin-containing monooxygenase [Herpetosiphon giganteus]|uniref:flavin-containing monooxygenase n=1 Tax=Herpetosiphon giganteus TaxID=2029754 RepID=UPI00195641EC|nr:NAD(P)/FAD-dependent oxidoreductase [Herpetosiphon giganteus]MBM7844464.1 putative flavoprotein involved in K+ transport [Herpetosiphon giganteus]
MPKQTIVIGAGQAGLAAGYWLQRAKVPFQILEAQPLVGGSWPAYYASLKLFSPARFSSLPGLDFPAPAASYPDRDAVVAYLRRYAEHFKLPIQTNTPIRTIERQQAGFRLLTNDGRVFQAGQLIAATGAFSRPFMPQLPDQGLFQGQILHSASYRTPRDFAGKRVIVVGAGNSAIQIALELAEVANVTLATRQPIRFQAQTIAGRDLHWWWWLTGFDRLSLDSRLGRWIQQRTQGIVLDTGLYNRKISQNQPQRRAMFERFTETGIVWAAGQPEPVDVVLFATGYRPALGYLQNLDALDEAGLPLHKAGVSTTVDNLYYVGLEQQYNFASATLRGVGADAARVVRQIQAHAHQPTRCCRWAVWQ